MQWMSKRFELSRNDGLGNVRPMEGLRGFAVFLVFLVHYATLMAPWITKGTSLDNVTAYVHTIGNAGVDLFFVLSGYLIYGSLISRDQSFLSFMARRIRRIYPAFSVMFAVYLVLLFVQPGIGKIPVGTYPALLYILQNYLLLPGIFKIDPIITVAWSLSYEMLYYLALPPLIFILNMRSRRSIWRVVFFAASGVGIIIASTAYDGPLRLVMFIAGILLHEALRARMAPPGAALVCMLVIISLFFTTAPYYGPVAWAARISVLFCAFFFLCLHCFTLPTSWLGHVFSFKPLRWLGNMSYSYYLIHGLALKMIVTVVHALIPAVSNQTLFVLGALLPIFFLTLLAGAALFLLVERPFSLKSPTSARAKSPGLADGAVR